MGVQLISTYDDIDKKQWHSLVEKSKFATFFQTESCFLFFRSLSMMRAFVFALMVDGKLQGIVVGYLTLSNHSFWQHFTQRAIICGGPLLNENISNEAVCVLMTEVKNQLAKDTIYIESRNFNAYDDFKPAFKKAGFEYQSHLNFQIDTSSLNSMDRNISKSRKRDIRLSIRKGAHIIENPSWNRVVEYYDILSHLYQKKIRLPLFPIEFFKKLYALNESHFILIEMKGKIIGGVVSVSLTNKTVYEWYACGINGIYDKVTATSLATYATMTYAAENGFPRYDMMGAGVPNKYYGVRKFKAKFGGKLVQHGRFLCVTKKNHFFCGKLGVNFMKYFGFFH